MLFSCSVVATQTFKLPLRVVQFALEKMEHERDVEEIECLLANLIFRVSEPCKYIYLVIFSVSSCEKVRMVLIWTTVVEEVCVASRRSPGDGILSFFHLCHGGVPWFW